MKRNNLIVALLLIVVVLILVLHYIKTKHHIGDNTQHQDHHQDQHHKNHSSLNDTKNICTGYLTDKEYLEHMIPHHQVAVDISVELQKKTTWPKMQEILRKLIWTQKYEITLMHELNNSINYEQGMSRKKGMDKKYKSTTGDFVKPNTLGLTHTYCDPHFFDPEKHMEHIKKMKLTDEMYIHHMIPHHQVAVDMSKVLLTNTNNDYMIYLANRIIKSQQEEIVLLNELLDEKNYKASSNMLH